MLETDVYVQDWFCCHFYAHQVYMAASYTFDLLTVCFWKVVISVTPYFTCLYTSWELSNSNSSSRTNDMRLQVSSCSTYVLNALCLLLSFFFTLTSVSSKIYCKRKRYPQSAIEYFIWNLFVSNKFVCFLRIPWLQLCMCMDHIFFKEQGLSKYYVKWCTRHCKSTKGTLQRSRNMQKTGLKNHKV